MKKLMFSLLACTLAGAAFGQARSLQVNNTTPCTVYYQIRGAITPICGSTVNSAVIALPPFASITYPNSSSIPGMPATNMQINVAVVYDGPTPCAPASGFIGEPCAGVPPIFGYQIRDAVCMPCGQVNATWVPAPVPGAQATLNFN